MKASRAGAARRPAGRSERSATARTAAGSATATQQLSRADDTAPGNVAPHIRPLQLGTHRQVALPVFAAPMAGISCAPYRRLCCEHGAGAAVGEMVVASTLLTRHPESLRLATFHPLEGSDRSAGSGVLRSAQLYAVRPSDMEQAAYALVADFGAEHIDINMGCPVRKVTSRGGGAALPLRPRLLGRLVAAAVKGASAASGGRVPVTLKMRKGLSASLLTYLEAGRVAEAEGVAALTLHARTADQHYYPHADWSAIRQLVASVSVPVIGNGDIFEAGDAVRMMRDTGCAGVMVGRACLGRPWLFAEVAAAMAGKPLPPPPALGEVLRLAEGHVRAWCEWEGEARGVRQMRKLVPCYLHGFETAGKLQQELLKAASLKHWSAALAQGWHDPDERFPDAAARHPRLKGGGRPPATLPRVSLPQDWLTQRDSDEVPAGLMDAACEG